MATIFKLDYTGSEINQKLATVDETKNALESNYYTSTDIDTKFTEVDENVELLEVSLATKADLVGGKVPVEQLPDDIGSGESQVQVDYNQNDETQIDYIKNRPFYDTRIRSYYSQAENPNPVSFDSSMLNMSFYKVSDLILTREEIFNSTQLIVNEISCTLVEGGVQLETDDFVFLVESTGSFGFLFLNKSGTLNFTYSGYPMTLEVPEGEAGIYYQRGLNAGVPEGRVIEFIIGDGELKQIDPKFIPANLDFNLDDYYTKSEIDTMFGDYNTVLDEISILIGE